MKTVHYLCMEALQDKFHMKETTTNKIWGQDIIFKNKVHVEHIIYVACKKQKTKKNHLVVEKDYICI